MTAAVAHRIGKLWLALPQSDINWFSLCGRGIILWFWLILNQIEKTACIGTHVSWHWCIIIALKIKGKKSFPCCFEFLNKQSLKVHQNTGEHSLTVLDKWYAEWLKTASASEEPPTKTVVSSFTYIINLAGHRSANSVYKRLDFPFMRIGKFSALLLGILFINYFWTF